jgi:hypothetical protein
MTDGTASTPPVVANVLLVAGYAAAIGSAVKFVPMWRQRRLGRFLVFEAGTACVAVGWALHHRTEGAAINGAILAGLGLAWAATRRRSP